MLDKSMFADLSAVTGYMGAVLSDYTGEVLIEDVGKVSKGLKELSMQFNESFRDIHSVTEKTNLGGTHEIEITADKASIVMMCGGKDKRAHLHAFVILAKDASAGLAKIELRKVLDEALASV